VPCWRQQDLTAREGFWGVLSFPRKRTLHLRPRAGIVFVLQLDPYAEGAACRVPVHDLGGRCVPLTGSSGLTAARSPGFTERSILAGAMTSTYSGENT
jgi:hypothetical protein